MSGPTVGKMLPVMFVTLSIGGLLWIRVLGPDEPLLATATSPVYWGMVVFLTATSYASYAIARNRMRR